MKVSCKNERSRVEALKARALNVHGLAAWVLRILQNEKCGVNAHHKQLRLVETLSLGGKRQLILVECGGEKLLIGTGTETDAVQTMVLLQGEEALSMVRKSA